MTRQPPDLDEDIRDHIERETADNIARGLAPAEAARQARLAFGNATLARESVRAVWVPGWLDTVRQDLIYALRTLRRRPGFTLVTAASLALGIAANVVTFSVVDAALFRPLPYRNPEQLVTLYETQRSPRGEPVQIFLRVSNLETFRSIRSVFQGMDVVEGSYPWALTTGAGSSLRVGAMTPTLPAYLGVSPQLGRTFSSDDVAARDRVIISDTYWQRAYNRDPAVTGRALSFGDRTFTIVGVMPPTFRFLVDPQADAWTPWTGEGRGWTRLIGRLRSGLTLERAQRELDAALSVPTDHWTPHPVEIFKGDWDRAGSPRSTDGRATRLILFSLLGAVMCVLMIACANVASLLLSSALERRREVAVRNALGATRGRLARQFLIEGVALGALGSIGAFILSWWVVALLPAVLPRSMNYEVFDAAPPVLDWRVLMFGCLVGTVTGILCGTAPAWRIGRSITGEAMLGRSERIAGASRHDRRIRNVFQALQISLAVVLMVGAGLFVVSFHRMRSLPYGFDLDGLGEAAFSLPPEIAGSVDTQRLFTDRLIANVANLPGVAAVTAGQPPTGGFSDARFLADDADGQVRTAMPVEFHLVRPDYFRVTGLTRLEGREFGPDDTHGSPPVAIISENAARKYWPGQSAIGQHFRMYAQGPRLTVVGVVAHAKTILVARDGAEVYLSSAQRGDFPGIVFRLRGDRLAAIESIRAKIRALDSRVTLLSIRMAADTLNQFDPMGPSRLYAWIFGALGCIGVVTASFGLYGVLSYSVNQRTREIGVRTALGATSVRLRWMLLLEASPPVLAGVTLGIALAMALTRFIAPRLFQIGPRDPGVTVSVLTIVVLVCLVATLVPARRITRISAVEALRAE